MCKTWWLGIALCLKVVAGVTHPWRNDTQNLDYAENAMQYQQSWSDLYDNVDSISPIRLQNWSLGADMPIFWKDGTGCQFSSNEVLLTGGYSYNGSSLPQVTLRYVMGEDKWSTITDAPFVTGRANPGACDDHALYLVSGLSAKGKVAALVHAGHDWAWKSLPALGTQATGGFHGERWMGATAVIGDFLLLAFGTPSDPGVRSSREGSPSLPTLRLNITQFWATGAALWQKGADFPGKAAEILCTAVVGGNWFAFGGMRQNQKRSGPWSRMIAQGLPITDVSAGYDQFRESWKYDPILDKWTQLRNMPFPMVAADTVVVQDRYILLMGTSQEVSFRVGTTSKGILPEPLPFWTGYGDKIVCYDTVTDRFSLAGILPYGLATNLWTFNGTHVFGFGGEAVHHWNDNSENTVQIARIQLQESDVHEHALHV